MHYLHFAAAQTAPRGAYVTRCTVRKADHEPVRANNQPGFVTDMDKSSVIMSDMIVRAGKSRGFWCCPPRSACQAGGTAYWGHHQVRPEPAASRGRSVPSARGTRPPTRAGTCTSPRTPTPPRPSATSASVSPAGQLTDISRCARPGAVLAIGLVGELWETRPALRSSTRPTTSQPHGRRAPHQPRSLHTVTTVATGFSLSPTASCRGPPRQPVISDSFEGRVYRLTPAAYPPCGCRIRFTDLRQPRPAGRRERPGFRPR